MKQPKRKTPPALCIVDKAFRYHPADSHKWGSDEFRQRQIARGMKPRQAQQQDDRRAA